MVRTGLLLAIFAVGGSFAPLAERVRLGNAAARAGSPEAERLYDAAEENADDPGLVAFNRAALLFARDDFREAELQYLRCLEDRDIPAERRRSALYNRGVCLVLRGDDARIYRAAIRSFEDCLAVSAADDDLANNARQNLELAKMLWNRERSRQKDPPTPNEPNQDERHQPKPLMQQGETEPGDTSAQATANATQPGTATEPKPANAETKSTDQQRNGAGTVPVPKDEAEVQRLSPEDTKTLLDRTAARLKAARRQNELLRAGPERPNVRDW